MCRISVGDLSGGHERELLIRPCVKAVSDIAAALMFCLTLEEFLVAVIQ